MVAGLRGEMRLERVTSGGGTATEQEKRVVVVRKSGTFLERVTSGGGRPTEQVSMCGGC